MNSQYDDRMLRGKVLVVIQEDLFSGRRMGASGWTVPSRIEVSASSHVTLCDRNGCRAAPSSIASTLFIIRTDSVSMSEGCRCESQGMKLRGRTV